MKNKKDGIVVDSAMPFFSCLSMIPTAPMHFSNP